MLVLTVSSIFFFAFVAHTAEALSSGAPLAACMGMTPVHGPAAQPFPAPYVITATEIEPTRYQVTIEADSGTTFKGFLLQARSNLTDSAIGTFDTTDESQSIGCFSTPMSAATHVNSDLKTNVSVIWNAAASGEDFHFVATVLQDYGTFWVKIPGTFV